MGKAKHLKQFLSLSSLVLFLISFQNCSQFNPVSVNESSSVLLPSFFTCQSNSNRAPDGSIMKRLSKFELTNTIHDIFERYLNPTDLTNLMSEIAPLINEIPDDSVTEGMPHFDQRMTPQHIDKLIAVAEKIGEFTIQNTSIRNAILGSCSGNLSDVTCMRSFLSRFGTIVLRRPLTSEDVSWYEGVFTGHSDGYQNLIAALFSSPKFTYHVELGTTQSPASGVYELSSYEKASRLSYFLLQSLPDDALFSAAESENDLTIDEIRSHTDRILTLPHARTRLTKNLAEQLFKLSSTPFIRTDIDALNSMIAELDNLSTLDGLKNNMINEVYDFLHYIIWESEGGFEELMTSDYVFPKTNDLAEIYGTGLWNGSYATPVRAPAGERSGILTRAQQLVTGSASTRSIMRGVKVYTDYLCSELPAPADTEPPEGAILLATHSGREFVENMTEIRGTGCYGCHANIINPLGFTFESFDPLGRFRIEEDIYHPESSPESGTVLTRKRVNTQTSISLGADVLNGQMNHSSDLTRSLAQSQRAIACFNNKLWSFSLKQPSHIGQNDCAVSSLYQEMVYSNSILKTLKAIPLQPEFFQRKL